MTYFDRKLLVSLLEPKLRETFWPVTRVSSFCPTWAVGVGPAALPRCSGRIWAVHYGLERRLSLCVSIGWVIRDHLVFPVTQDTEVWGDVINGALLALARLMDEYEVRWVAPERSTADPVERVDKAQECA